MRSVAVVLPASMWAMMPTVRVSSSGKSDVDVVVDVANGAVRVALVATRLHRWRRPPQSRAQSRGACTSLLSIAVDRIMAVMGGRV